MTVTVYYAAYNELAVCHRDDLAERSMQIRNSQSDEKQRSDQIWSSTTRHSETHTLRFVLLFQFYFQFHFHFHFTALKFEQIALIQLVTTSIESYSLVCFRGLNN